MRGLILVTVVILTAGACTANGGAPSSTSEATALETVISEPATQVTPASAPQTSLTTVGSAGQGWELLAVATESSGLPPPFAFLDEASSDAEFLSSTFGVDVSNVSFADQILIVLPLPTGAGCEESARLDGLVIDYTSQLVYGEFTRLPRKPDCSGLLASLSFLIAVDRVLLPPRFTLQVESGLTHLQSRATEIVLDE